MAAVSFTVNRPTFFGTERSGSFANWVNLFLTLTLHDSWCTVLRKGGLKSHIEHPCVR